MKKLDFEEMLPAEGRAGSDSDDSEASAESAGGTIDWDIPLKLPRFARLAALKSSLEAEAAFSSASPPFTESRCLLPPISRAPVHQALDCMQQLLFLPYVCVPP
jgi:hypothetical protein